MDKLDFATWMLYPFGKDYGEYLTSEAWTELKKLAGKNELNEKRYAKLQTARDKCSLEEALETIKNAPADDKELSWHEAQDILRMYWNVLSLNFEEYVNLSDEISRTLEANMKKELDKVKHSKGMLIRFTHTARLIREGVHCAKDEEHIIKDPSERNAFARAIRTVLRKHPTHGVPYRPHGYTFV